jgi:hypothetical protein
VLQLVAYSSGIAQFALLQFRNVSEKLTSFRFSPAKFYITSVRFASIFHSSGFAYMEFPLQINRTEHQRATGQLLYTSTNTG